MAQVTLQPGAKQKGSYLPLLKDKTVAVFANQTSLVDGKHLVDMLLESGVKIKNIFSPEHGFRGMADAGEHVGSSIDKATKLPIISLYGDHKKPTATELEGIDILIFDIQDVGLRYYTYISSLQYFIETALENNKPLIILDRPNPNASYIDGPVLEKPFTSFVGLQPIPIVYGMTIGEYGLMLAGEGWLNEPANKVYSKLKSTGEAKDFIRVIPCKYYDHTSYFQPPVKPSPNLPNMRSIELYPSLCFFEGTEISLGRGTDKPFQLYGHPSFPDTLFSFTPESTDGAKNPPLKDKRCYGYDLSKRTSGEKKQINLSYLLNAYNLFPDKDNFFIRPKKGNPATSDYFFNKLAGNDQLMWQVMNGKSEAEIRKSWEPGLEAFKIIRKKYLLYADF